MRKRFPHNFKCLILYGSWAKGNASKDSDIDLLAVLERVDDEIRRLFNKIESSIDTERHITLLPVSIEDFRKEKIPLYTAVKKERQDNSSLAFSKKHLGEEIASAFKKLFDLYIKSEYGREFLTEKEARLAVEYAKKILKVYNLDAKINTVDTVFK